MNNAVQQQELARRNLALEVELAQTTRRLTHLVENLLHFSRSERQAHRVAPEPTWMAPLIRSVVEAFAPLAVPRRVRLRADIADGVVAAVDPEAFRQMLLNLLDNAVKYGPEDQSVTVTLAPADAAGRVRVTVDDQGPGIPPAERERIWERFWRLERDRGSAVAGTGIGLAVVRELAALHRCQRPPKRLCHRRLEDALLRAAAHVAKDDLGVDGGLALPTQTLGERVVDVIGGFPLAWKRPRFEHAGPQGRNVDFRARGFYLTTET